MAAVNYNKHIYEGWTVQDYVNDLQWSVDFIMCRRSWQKPFETREEVKKWCMDHQPYYKKYIPDVVNHFCKRYDIKT